MDIWYNPIPHDMFTWFMNALNIVRNCAFLNAQGENMSGRKQIEGRSRREHYVLYDPKIFAGIKQPYGRNQKVKKPINFITWDAPHNVSSKEASFLCSTQLATVQSMLSDGTKCSDIHFWKV